MLSFQKNRGLRIDAILASDALSKKCSASGIDRELRKGIDPSDHAAIWAQFNDQKTPNAQRRTPNVELGF